MSNLIDSSEIIEKVSVALAESAKDGKIRAFIDVEFSPTTVVNIYQGREQGFQPERSDYPVIVISNVIKTTSEVSDETQTLLLPIECGIIKATKLDITEFISGTVKSRIKRYPGLKIVNNFGKLIESEIIYNKTIQEAFDFEGSSLLNHKGDIYTFASMGLIISPILQKGI